MDRAERVSREWDARSGEPYVTDTRWGTVRIDRLEVHADEGRSWVDVWADGAEGGDPHFRIVNPPLLVEDPGGPVVIGGRTFREDPLAAVAEAIASNGGAQRQRRRAR